MDKTKRISVSKDFALSLDVLRSQYNKEVAKPLTRREISMPKFTEIIAKNFVIIMNKPSIELKKREKN